MASYLSSETSQRAGALSEGNPVITLSREEGSGGDLIAHRAGELLTARSGGRCKWLVLDKSIAEEIIRDHHLPDQIRDFLSDEQVSYVRDLVEELIGLHPDRVILVRKMVETILHLAKIGNVIFVGRATHIVLAGMPAARHIRIVGTLDRRTQRFAAQTGLPLDKARIHIRRVDRSRKRFVWHFFHVDIRDPHGYDMILNTDRLSVDEAARIVAEMASSPPPLVRRHSVDSAL